MSAYRNRPINRPERLPADLAAALGVTTQGELWDMLNEIVVDVIAEETGADGPCAGTPVHLVRDLARKPRLADG